MKFAQPVWNDLKYQLQDGSILDIYWTNIYLPNGQILGIGKDITAHKQSEQLLNAQIEREKLMRTIA
ncbi:hypothetical protein [Trichormus azollae]|jgi:hypothetical protein|uniref:hypothetical protein n=1 Tax=Trichormus azollae TaxID=1164 RepID=UPI0001958D3C|nr:hypothetical protein [Trichormus azollae]